MSETHGNGQAENNALEKYQKVYNVLKSLNIQEAKIKFANGKQFIFKDEVGDGKFLFGEITVEQNVLPVPDES